MAKLKYVLMAVEAILVFRILHMDEEFRSGSGGDDVDFKASNGINIRSGTRPEINMGTHTAGTVYLRGMDKAHDFDVSTTVFLSPIACIKARDNIHAALKDWAENWEGWPKEATVPATQPQIVFEV